jgi:hypothetical protein
MHASLTRQTVPWEALIALDGASPDRLPAPLAQDARVRTLSLPRPVGAACARNLALNHVRTPYTNWADDDDEFTDNAMDVRLNTLESTGVGWCAGWSEDRYPDGSTAQWRCPTPPGRHEAGDVWTYWKSPADTIPIGPTTILARTDLVRAAPMGGLVQGEDYCAYPGTSRVPRRSCRLTRRFKSGSCRINAPSHKSHSIWRRPCTCGALHIRLPHPSVRISRRVALTACAARPQPEVSGCRAQLWPAD